MDALSPSCQRIAIVGSIRRQRPVVGDMELLCIPLATAQADMFGVPLGTTSLLDVEIDKLVKRGDPWAWDKKQPRRGEKWKRLIYVPRDLMCDLFVVTARAWAANVLVRTGPSGFSQHVMSAALRKGWHFADGFLLHRHSAPCSRGPECPYILEVENEKDILDALYLPWREPTQREGFKTVTPSARTQ